MGHADLATTMGYAHLADEDLLAPSFRAMIAGVRVEAEQGS